MGSETSKKVEAQEQPSKPEQKTPQLKKNDNLQIQTEEQEVQQGMNIFDPRSPHVGVPRTPYVKTEQK